MPGAGSGRGDGAAGECCECVAGVVADDRPGTGVAELQVVLVDSGHAEGVLRADATQQLYRARLLHQGVSGDRVVAPAQVAADGVGVRVAIPFDRLDRRLLLDAPPGPSSSAQIDLERALLL